MKMHYGLQLWPQNTTWDSLREHGLLADELGFDSLWTWDHFMPIAGGAPDGAQFESWQILAAWGAITTRVRIGTLVSGNTYRHPAVLAKQVAALDHITNGRAILGIGAAWMEAEHKAYGIDFGKTPGERLARLGEAVRIIRSLLDTPRTTFKGKHYTITDALAEPKPIQMRVPIMIGGGGERKTLRITARYADMWHGFGTPEEIAHKIEVLYAHCKDVGRDPGEILPTTGGQMVVTDDPKAVDARVAAIRAANRNPQPPQRPFSGTPEQCAARVAAYWKAGARGFILGTASPHDRANIERFAREVRPLADKLIAA